MHAPLFHSRALSVAALLFAHLMPGYAQTYDQGWTASSTGSEQVSAVKINSQGHILAVTVFQQDAAFNGEALPYPAHIYLSSISPQGEVEWSRPAGAHVWNFNFERTGLVLDEDDNIYIAAPYGTDTHVGDTTLTGPAGINTFIAKFAPTGELLWAKPVAAGLFTRGMDRAPNGDMALAGITQGLEMVIGSDTVEVLGNQSTDMVLVKLDAQGEVLWYDRSGGPGWYSDNCMDVAFDANGNIIMTGHIRSDSWFDGIFLEDAMTGNVNGFVAGYSPDGVAQWVTRLGYEPQGIAADAFGNTYAVGYHDLWNSALLVTGVAGADHYLARLDGSGNIQWVVQPGDQNFGFAYDVVTDDAGDPWVVGHHRDSLVLGPFTEVAPGLNSLMAYKADANGNVEWMDLQCSPGTTSDFRGIAIAHDDSCGLVIAGSYNISDPWSQGTATLQATTSTDAFILSMADCSIALTVAGDRSHPDVLLFPSPASELVHVTCPATPDALVRVTDMLGRPMPVGIVRAHKEWTVDVRQLSVGQYVLHLRTKDKTTATVFQIE